MKVTNQTSPNANRIENKAAERLPGAKDSAKPSQVGVEKEIGQSKGSLVEISDGARLMQRAVEVAKQAPEGRAERVASLKQAIQDGSYKVDAKKVADRLVDDHLANDFGKNNL